MGLSYLDGEKWEDITREERFFCMHLYRTVQERGVVDFVRLVKALSCAGLNPDSNWEIGVEVCFYRDFRHFRMKKIKDENVKLQSSKRTFDLCLFSDDTIVIIEAKCAETFKPDQLRDFKADLDRFEGLSAECPELKGVKIIVLGLAAKKYVTELAVNNLSEIEEYFTANTSIMTWEDIGEYYSDPLLTRGGEIFDKQKVNFEKNNSGGKRSVPELRRALQENTDFWVGRQGGIEAFASDLQGEQWQQRRYQTNTIGVGLSESNWFKLSEVRELLLAMPER